ncbi:UPF0575 protein C19orf67 homolog [Echeneis naucrates]|uniref:UPF0575 protein C19orf67 homolog n=1 Tax=Echeneis naucrates TaxID=173247 RepID=UPI001113D3EF|nr:UPF0575 protein C19orf67 homolog [Echeneis naucrates]
MTDIEDQVELQLDKLPSEQQTFGDRLQEDVSGERWSDCGEEVEDPLPLLDDAALAPPGGKHAACSCDPEACCLLEVKCLERSLQSMQLQLQFFMTKSDNLHDCLMNGQGHLDRDSLAAVIPSFLRTCQPYFNHLESTARSTVSQYTSTPDICTKLLDFSQQLCDRLEQLVLAFASYNLLCLNESEPNSTSHFCIGQSRLGQLKMTVFRYCKATPYLARVDTGLYKRMRWNVERLQNKPKEVADEEQNGDSKEAEAETVGDTEYYFLCYEDIANTHTVTDSDSQGVCYSGTVRMWSIGQWVQVNPNPTTDDIYDWITCEVPQAIYHRLLFLGSDEPSSSGATDYLQQLLLSRQTKD